MASLSILPLHQINILPVVAWVATNIKKVNSYSKIADAVATVPGVGNIKDMIINMLKAQADALIKTAKVLIVLLIRQFMQEQLAKLPFVKFVNKINKMIEKVNKVLKGVEDAISVLKTLLAPLFPVLIVLTVAFVVAKVITMIPIFGGGMGFVVSAGQPQDIAGSVMTTCEKLLGQLKPIPGAVIATIMQLISIFAMIQFFQMMFNAFLAKQSTMESSAAAAAAKTADDWANSSESNTELNKILKKSKTKQSKSSSLNEANLNNVSSGMGDSISLDGNQGNQNSNFGNGDGINDSNTGAILADNLLERLAIINQINNINKEINGVPTPQNKNENGEIIGDCALPDGTTIQATTEECENLNGEFGYGSPPTNPPSPPSSPYTDANGNVYCWEEPPGEWIICGGPNFIAPTLTPDEINNLKLVKGGLESELDSLGGQLSEEELSNVPPEISEQLTSVFENLGNDIITSLLNSDPDVTIQKATQNFGTRYGFYQQDITNTSEDI